MGQQLSDLAEQTLAAAKRAGADAADVLCSVSDGISMEVRAGQLELAERDEGLEVGLRALVGQRQACVSVSDTRPAAIEAMAERAVAMAKEAPEDPYCGLADAAQLATDIDVASLDLCDPAPLDDPQSLVDLALRAEAAALAIKGVSQVSSAGVDASRGTVQLATSNGFSQSYDRSGMSISCVAITGTGLEMERDYAHEARVYASDLPGPEAIGQLAAERTLARAGAVQPKTGAFPVLFDERVSTGLIGHLSAAINGASIARGTSWLKDALGQQVLPRGIDLTSDPSRPRISGSRPFDGEALPVARRAVVKDGVLTGWTLDLSNARKLGMTSTGDARRGVSSPPSPALGNLDLTPGARDRAALLADMGEGLLVTSLMGSTINPNTGDYSRGASGFWVRGGQIAEPVNECTIAGNLRQMLLSMVPANDGRMHLSRVVPSLLIEGMTIAGN